MSIGELNDSDMCRLLGLTVDVKTTDRTITGVVFSLLKEKKFILCINFY
jgi:hypothetical protein